MAPNVKYVRACCGIIMRQTDKASDFLIHGTNVFVCGGMHKTFLHIAWNLKFQEITSCLLIQVKKAALICCLFYKNVNLLLVVNARRQGLIN